MKSLGKIIVLFILAFMLNTVRVDAANGVDITDHKNGTIGIDYSNSELRTILVQIRKSDTSVDYNYFCSDKNISIDIPLTLGNGSYTVKVLKNVSGKSYSSLDSANVSLKLSDEKEAFLTSSYEIKWNETNQAVKKAASLTKSAKKSTDKIKAVYKYIVENYSYDTNKMKKVASGALTNYVPDIEQVYRAKKGICYDISSLNASMLRSLGIETKVIKGYPTNPALAKGTYHAWNKAYDSSAKKWIIMDATTDMQLYDKVDYKAMSKKASQYSNERYVY